MTKEEQESFLESGVKTAFPLNLKARIHLN